METGATTNYSDLSDKTQSKAYKEQILVYEKAPNTGIRQDLLNEIILLQKKKKEQRDLGKCVTKSCSVCRVGVL